MTVFLFLLCAIAAILLMGGYYTYRIAFYSPKKGRDKISTFASHHYQIDRKLTELKNIIIKYYPEKENNNLLNAVLFDIFNCEQDLASHCQVEDYMFVPAVAQMERRVKDEHQ